MAKILSLLFGKNFGKPSTTSVFGQQIEVRCWDSIDARIATPTRLSFEILEKVAGEVISKMPGIVSVTYNIVTKPPSTIEVAYYQLIT